MKQSGLKRDPEKLREFEQRGRGALKADPAAARAWQQRTRERMLEAARATPAREVKRHKGRVRFRAPSPAGEHTCSKAGCSKAACSWHHWLPQAAIRDFVRSLRIREEQLRRRLEARLLGDVRNLSPFCRAHHGQHGTAAHRYELREVPASAFEFAGELGAEWAAKLAASYVRPGCGASSEGPEPPRANDDALGEDHPGRGDQRQPRL